VRACPLTPLRTCASSCCAIDAATTQRRGEGSSPAPARRRVTSTGLMAYPMAPAVAAGTVAACCKAVARARGAAKLMGEAASRELPTRPGGAWAGVSWWAGAGGEGRWSGVRKMAGAEAMPAGWSGCARAPRWGGVSPRWPRTAVGRARERTSCSWRAGHDAEGAFLGGAVYTHFMTSTLAP
jgi:hypothetical protein